MERRVAKTAKAQHIENLLGRNIFALSGGEKQKIAFASVYAMHPEVYLLDEPSSNLDMTAICELREHLRLIKSQGKTVIVAEHRLYYLMDVADRIIYLENGRITGDFTTDQFRLLSVTERQAMGLRAIELREETPVYFHATNQQPILELQNMALAYKKQPVLKNISLKAAPGEVIAVVGHNGAGKTTFSRAMCGLHKEASGSYLWNGKPQKPKARMKRSYVVMQDVNYQLFAESVETECTFGIRHPDTTLAERTLEELGLAPFYERHLNTLSGGQKQRLAARDCGCYDFIMWLENGFDTVVGCGGGHLSGGERQRLSIARAMMKDAPIIILDEATANVDPENEKELMETISELTQEKTVIMIAHRLKTVRGADQILVVDKGQIVQRGTHEALMTQNGIYRRFISGREQAVGWKL